MEFAYNVMSGAWTSPEGYKISPSPSGYSALDERRLPVCKERTLDRAITKAGIHWRTRHGDWLNRYSLMIFLLVFLAAITLDTVLSL